MVPEAPKYDLDDVRAAASDEMNLELMYSAERDRLNLDYALGDVAQCIQSLHPDHYRKTDSYTGSRPDVFDCYVIRFWLESKNCEDELYVKLKLSPRGKVVIASFHLEGRII